MHATTANPSGLASAAPSVLVIPGASGDLTKRLLVPGHARLPAVGRGALVVFKPGAGGAAAAAGERNRLIFHIQPTQGVEIRMQAKRPGPVLGLQPVGMRFDYAETFDAAAKHRSHDTSRHAWARLIGRVGEEFPLGCPGDGSS